MVSSISIYNKSSVCTQWNSFKYCYITVTIKHQIFVYTQLNDRTVLFLTIKLSINYLFGYCSSSSIWLIDRILSGAATQSQSGPESDVNEGVLHIP